MRNRLIDKTAIAAFLDELCEANQVLAPLPQGGVLAFGLLGEGSEAVLEFYNTRQAPKEIFIPRSETLFTYEDGQVTPASPPQEGRVVFGIRPCDARSAVLLDLVFDTPDDRDPYYVGRRKSTVLIGLACNAPLSTCFCTSVGGGPSSVDGLDLLFTDLGDRYLVEAITERGEALVAESSLFRPATEAELAQKSEITARAEEVIARTRPSTEGVKEKLDAAYDHPFWAEMHLKCLGCGACTYLCPTCHCFDIVDEGDSVRGRRVRNWDTCQFALFTHHTSGHNPRPGGKERMRQRVMHKFNYFVENLNEIACVGCGRCVRDCPVNLDIRATIEAIRQLEVG